MKIKSIFYTALFLLFTTSLFAAQATLSWNPNSESDLAGYKVYHGKISKDNSTFVNYEFMDDVGNVTSYIVTDLVEGEIYFFAATAYDFSGNESGYSNEVSYDVPIIDVTKPVITILGDNPVTVERGTEYIDAGATAWDDIDGGVFVDTTGFVDTSETGTYTMTYTATDEAGNTATAIRTVTVIEDTTAPLPPTGLALLKNPKNTLMWDKDVNKSKPVFSHYEVSKNGKVINGGWTFMENMRIAKGYRTEEAVYHVTTVYIQDVMSKPSLPLFLMFNKGRWRYS